MDRVTISNEIVSRIKALRETKFIENKRKLAQKGGSYNIDDHGYIYFADFHFEPEFPEGSDVLYGEKCVGENLGRFFKEMPVYIHPQSALAGAWAGFFQEMYPTGICEADQPVHLFDLHKKYGLQQTGIGGMNHLSPDMEIGLSLGFQGMLNKIRYYKHKNQPASADFYAGHEAVMVGIIDYTKNHLAEAQRCADESEDEWEKENYAEIASVLENLLQGPPRTFREACQFLAIFQSADRTYFGGGALGQLDELLRLYYEQDTATGVITDEDAVWMLASLFYNDTHYSQIGGQSPDGTRELTSPLSYLILEASHVLAIPSNLNVRVFEGSDNKLLHRALEHIMACGTGAAFSLSKGIEEGFVKQGHPIELARMRAKVGCNWVALPGIEYPLQDVTRLNMAWPLHYALEDVMVDGNPDMTKLWERFAHHLAIAVKCLKDGYDWHYEVVSRNTPELVLNLFCHGPIERGLNSAQGGVDILNLNIDGIALATVADSFAAIEQRVMIEEKLTWAEMHHAVKNNYADAEEIRLMLKSIPRYGNPDSLALDWAIKIRDEFVNLCIATPTPKHQLKVIPGMFSHGDVYMYGEVLPATPNGRFDGEEIAHSNDPDPGFANGIMSFSPTLKANAVALTQPGWGNSAPLHLDIDTNMVEGAGGIEALVALIQTHNQMGGTLINLNCVTPDQILKAHENPEAYPDLVVRVTGYSAFFHSLSREYRQQLVDRYLS
ncbi:MAG: hypothetical protein FWE07_02825 [Turicibacter sp.]|nr:hypothetical protein [Turicibacter sp.]